MRKKRSFKRDNKTIELQKAKPRKEEEKFFMGFSERQSSAVLLIILASTFLVQGTIRYLEILGEISLLSNWFNIVLFSLVFVTSSVIIINIGGVISSLKYKRIMGLISFGMFLLGFILFLISLIYLLIMI